jgi:hypothetical protein
MLRFFASGRASFAGASLLLTLISGTQCGGNQAPTSHGASSGSDGGDASTDAPARNGTCATVGTSCVFRLASGQDYPSSIAIDQGTLYWTNEHARTVLKMPSTGGTPVTVATPSQQALEPASAASIPTRVGPLFVAEGSLYWWAVSDTLTAPHSCGSGGPCSQSPGACWPMTASLSGDSSPSPGGSISGADPDPMSGIGGNADGVYFAAPSFWLLPGIAFASILANPFGVVGDGHAIYWTDRGAGTVTAGATTPAGPPGAPATLATGQSKPSLIALARDTLYWTNAGDGTVMAVPTSGGTPVILAQGQASPYGIAASTSAIYWTDQDGGTVMKVPPDGGIPVTLASGEPTPYALALDDTNVYFTTYVANGSVMKLTEGCTCP